MIAAYDVELSRLLGQMMSHAPEARPNALVVSRRLANIARKHEDESLREWAAAAFSAADRGERPSPDRVRPVTTPTLRGSRDKAQASSHIPAFVGAGLLLLAGLGLSAALFASLLIRLFDPGHVSASAPLANVTAADAPPAPVAPPASAPPPVEDPNPPETSPPAPPVGGPQAVAAQTPSAVASPRSMGSPPVAPAAGTSLAQRPTIRPEAAESGAGTAGTENPWAATTAPTAAPTAAPAVVSTESSATQVACGRIQVSGASYRLARPPASGCAAGQVPAGSYTVIVSFPEEADQSYPISVSRGGVTRLRCDALLSVCQEGGG